jgi:hypothetical protein
VAGVAASHLLPSSPLGVSVVSCRHQSKPPSAAWRVSRERKRNILQRTKMTVGCGKSPGHGYTACHRERERGEGREMGQVLRQARAAGRCRAHHVGAQHLSG